MHKKLISHIGKGVTECVLELVEYADEEEKEIVNSQPKYELKEACTGVYLHKVGNLIDETVFVFHPVMENNEGNNRCIGFPSNFFEVNTSSVLKELRDDINEVGMVKLKCDKNTKPRCDWLIQFLVAYVCLADATKPKTDGGNSNEMAK